MLLGLRQRIHVEGEDLVHFSHFSVPLNRSDLHKLTFVVNVHCLAASLELNSLDSQNLQGLFFIPLPDEREA